MSISLGPYNSSNITDALTTHDYNMQHNNFKENFVNNHTNTNTKINDNDNDNNVIIISPYLEKFVKLWVWDWDDTLIDVGAYIRHKMDRDTILSLSNKELEFDVPNYVYFKSIVEYLVSTGRRVGIASFGTYSIIRAYMDKIFGFGQKLFTEINIYAVCQNIDNSCNYNNIPINKNAYIQRLMKHYSLNNPKTVVLFDDRPSNIADASRMGVIPIQINTLEHNKSDIRNNLQAKKSILFGPVVMLDLESRIRSMCQNNPAEYDKQFGQLGDFKVMKKIQRLEGEIINIDNGTNFNLNAFTNLGKSDNFNELKKNKRKKTKAEIELDKKLEKQNRINNELEGFQIGNEGFYNEYNNNNIYQYLTGLFNDNHKFNIINNNDNYKEGFNNNNDNKKCNINESFESCLSCQSSFTTWFICGIFLLMVGLIVFMFIKF